MLLEVSVASAIAVLLWLLWLLKRAIPRPDAIARLHPIDLAAFRNLLSRDDDDFLRSSLVPRHYRKVRRERLRAVQEYLVWMAENCVVLLAMLQSQGHEDPWLRRETQLLARSAFRIRVSILISWVLVWGEYVFTDLRIQPLQLLIRYEELRRGASACVRPQTAAN
jgi:hypothetical protein